MKKSLRAVALCSSALICGAVGLSACNEGGYDYSFVSGSEIKVSAPCKLIYEAEFADTSYYEISDGNEVPCVERSDASGGKFLAAANGGYFSFTLTLMFNAEIEMAVAYAQTEINKANELDMRNSYNFLIDENRSVSLSEEECILPARNDITDWHKISYDNFTLPKGMHSVRISVPADSGSGNPNIDYIEFNFIQTAETNFDGISVPENDFHAPVQYAYINDGYEKVANYAKGVAELSRPNAIILDYSFLKNSRSYFVQYADNTSFDNCVTLRDIQTKYCAVYNLKLGQKLYWRAATSEGGLKKADMRLITIASEGPRNIYIDGVTNVRDIGGYSSSLVDGGVIRQGLYYRGAALVDVDLQTGEEKARLITKAGEDEMLRLGIKEEIDLRDEKQCTGAYIEGINYNAIPIPSGTESKRFEEFEEEYKQIFSIIANADQRPVYLHCTAGADRTGICSFMLLTVCGASYEDMARDYLFTNFSTHGERKLSSEFEKWYNKLDNFSGATKADKAKSWLISKGVTAEQVEHIREIFVEGYNG